MIAQLTENDITLVTRATPAVLAVVPSLEGRRFWLKGGGLKIENTVHNLERIKAAFPDLVVQGSSGDVALFDGVPAPKIPFSFKRDPDPHQLTAFERACQHVHFALLMEQGTGKTKVGIDRACKLWCDGAITGVLVVTKKGVHRQWIESELPKDHSQPFEGGWWRNKPIEEGLLTQGETLKWFAINYDALRGKQGFEMAEKFCKAHRGRLLIIGDESQCIMNHSSIRHKRMQVLKGHSSHRLILTGTPIAKDLTDEWAQLLWLNEKIIGIKYLTTFRAQFCIMGGYDGRSVVGTKNLAEFQAKTAPYTYRVTKEQIGYIPKRYSDWIFDLTQEQRRLIQQVKQELIAQLEDGQTIGIASATSAFMKVQQIANGFIIDSDNGPSPIRLMPVEKNPRAIAMLEWLDSHEGKAVMWTRFTEDRRIVGEALASAGIGFGEYAGSDDQRFEAKRSFIGDPGVRVFLGNPQSGGTGLDGLQTVCTQALYYSNSFNSLDRWQSEDRIDRRGMIGGSHYTDLIAKGSIDRYIIRNLKKKKGISALTLGDIQDAFEGVGL